MHWKTNDQKLLSCMAVGRSEAIHQHLQATKLVEIEDDDPQWHLTWGYSMMMWQCCVRWLLNQAQTCTESDDCKSPRTAASSYPANCMHRSSNRWSRDTGAWQSLLHRLDQKFWQLRNARQSAAFGAVAFTIPANLIKVYPLGLSSCMTFAGSSSGAD